MALYSAAYSETLKAIANLSAAINTDVHFPFNINLFDANERSKILSRIAQLSQARDQLAIVEKQVLEIQNMLQERRSKVLQHFAYIEILPPDIIWKIFTFAYRCIPSVTERLAFSRNVSHVSRIWRDIALHQSEIWSFLLISFEEKALGPYLSSPHYAYHLKSVFHTAISLFEVLSGRKSCGGPEGPVFLPSLETTNVFISNDASVEDVVKIERLVRMIFTFACERGSISPSRNPAYGPLRRISLSMNNTDIWVYMPEGIYSRVEEFSGVYILPKWWTTSFMVD